MEPESTKKALEIALPFLDKLVSPPIDELGLLLQDQIRLWRFNRQLDMLQKARAKIQKSGIKIKPISLKVLVPILEGVSLEEDVFLNEMWANLLVNYADESKKITTTVFPYILSQLSRVEALSLEYHFRTQSRSLFYAKYQDNIEMNLSNTDLYNLVRLGLIRQEYHGISGGGSVGAFAVDHEHLLDENSDSCYYHVTALGISFIQACTVKV